MRNPMFNKPISEFIRIPEYNTAIRLLVMASAVILIAVIGLLFYAVLSR